MTKVWGLFHMYQSLYQRTNAAATSTVSGYEVLPCRILDGVVSHERMRGGRVYVRAGRFKIWGHTKFKSDSIR